MSQKVKPVWIDFAEGKIRANLVKEGTKMSTVKYLQAVNFPPYSAKKGENRRVSNIFISQRR